MDDHPSPSACLDAEFSAWLRSQLAAHHVPGLSVSVVDAHSVCARGYGLARLPDVPATADTVWCMASTTKAFTAAALGQILEHHAAPGTPNADWSTPVARLLPRFRLADAHLAENVTLEDFLAHRSGLPGHDFMYGQWAGGSPGDVVARLADLPAQTQHFRSGFQYNNLGYAVAGHVAEELEGKAFEDVLRDRIWRPLGMESTSLGPSRGPPTLARGYFWVADESGGSYLAEPYHDVAGVAPAMGIYSSVADYARWMRALLAAAQPAQDPSFIVSPRLFAELTTPRTLYVPPATAFPDIVPLPSNAQLTPTTYALGWYCDHFMFPGEVVVRHAGSLPGFAAHVFLLPRLKFGVAVAANAEYDGLRVAQMVGMKVLGRRLGVRRETTREGDRDVKGLDAVDASAQDMEAESAGSDPQRSEPVLGIASLCGRYSHPSYGSLSVAPAASASLDSQQPSLDAAKILRTAQERSTVPSIGQPMVLQATLEGHRSLRSSFVLHPSPIESSGCSGYALFDLEKLMAHGNLQDDHPRVGAGQGSASAPDNALGQQMLWESIQTCRLGASFELGEAGNVKAMGLQLARSGLSLLSSGIEGQARPIEGWKKHLVWFEKSVHA